MRWAPSARRCRRKPPAAPAPVKVAVSDAARRTEIEAMMRFPHVWMASAFGALCFGTMLALGVVWAPKLLAVRGFEAATANWAASLLWLGLFAPFCSIGPSNNSPHAARPSVPGSGVNGTNCEAPSPHIPGLNSKRPFPGSEMLQCARIYAVVVRRTRWSL
jgi:hypothetical protein